LGYQKPDAAKNQKQLTSQVFESFIFWISKKSTGKIDKKLKKTGAEVQLGMPVIHKSQEVAHTNRNPKLSVRGC
jgi:hypothetical protein